MKYVLFIGAAMGVLSPFAAARAADPVKLPEVITRAKAETPDRKTIDLDYEKTLPYADGGELLQSIPGVSGSRMGSHGIDPFIRGAKQGQLNIIDDGLFVHGGCPNRMDPPSSYLSLEGNDELVVEKGYSSVTHGAGGAGGTVYTKRHAPVFDADKNYNVTVNSGFNSNGRAYDLGIKGDYGFDSGYVRTNVERKRARLYKDGNGDSVRSGYKNVNARLDFGYDLDEKTKATLGGQFEDTRDALFAGASMDAPYSQNYSFRGAVERKVDFANLNKVTANAYGTYVDHIMDNFTLRSKTGMGMLTDSQTRTWGGKIMGEGEFGKNKFTIGTDLKSLNQDAIRYMGSQTSIRASGNDHAYMWPDITTDSIGLFAEDELAIDEVSTLKVGLRYDYVHVDADKANRISSKTNRSANNLYNLYYGREFSETNEHNFSGLARYDYKLTDSLAVFGKASRSTRSADATERALAGDHATESSRSVGNPGIDPEKHHQIEVGSSYTRKTWSLAGNVYYNRVQDYILRDKARGQSGILLSDDATIYRNVEATLTGFEIEGDVEIVKGLTFASNLAYTYGENEDDNRPLAQIAPMELTSSLEYAVPDWMVGLRMRAVSKQNRADTGTENSGLDIEKTAGFTVFDLYGKVYSLDPVDISLGISNIFNKTYANHLNRSNAFNPQSTKVNEPGRSFYVRLSAKF